MLKKLALGGTVLLAVAAALVLLLLNVRPSLDEWDRFRPRAMAKGELEIRWLGTSTLYLSDGRTHLLTDGYFSRVPVWRLGGDLAPDEERIDRVLAREGIDDLDAVLVVHSHFDHAMDAPTVALRTGAELVGSASTANVGLGGGMPPERVRVATAGEPLHYGDFEVVFLHSDHVPQSDWIDALTGMNETIDMPLTPPAPVSAWKEGESWALLVRHPAGNVLIQGSAGFREGQLEGHRADVAFVSTVGLFRQPAGYTGDYLRNTVEATGAAVVVPIHWDDFFVELDGEVPPLPRVMEDLDTSFALLETALAGKPASLLLLHPGESLFLPVPTPGKGHSNHL